MTSRRYHRNRARIAAVLLLLALMFMGAPGPLHAQDRPALWSISDTDTTVHLFGTIHLMQQEVEWLTGEVRTAFEASDTLVLELDQTEVSRTRQQEVVRELALLPENESLSQLIPEADMKRLMAMLEPFSVSRATAERWKPWYAAIIVVSVSAAEAGFLPHYGVDATLLRRAQEREIDIRGLESAAFQLRLFDDLDREESVYFLTDALAEAQKLGELFEDLKESWLSEELEALEALLLESRQENPDFYDDVYVERNKHWLPDIIALLEEPGTHFVAVGTGHLLGDGGLLSMLRDSGYAVKRR